MIAQDHVEAFQAVQAAQSVFSLEKSLAKDLFSLNVLIFFAEKMFGAFIFLARKKWQYVFFFFFFVCVQYL